MTDVINLFLKPNIILFGIYHTYMTKFNENNTICDNPEQYHRL